MTSVVLRTFSDHSEDISLACWSLCLHQAEYVGLFTFSELSHDQEGRNSINLPFFCIMITWTMSSGISYLLIIAKYIII